MKKETVIAVILGISAGILVAFFMIIKARENQIRKAKPITTALNLTPTIAFNNNQLKPLDISQPETGTVVNAKTITIKGSAGKGGILIIQSPLKQMVQKLDSDKFEIKDFPLALGENVILVTSYPVDKQLPSQERELRIYYLDE